MSKKQVPQNGRNTTKGYRGVQVRKDLRLAIYLRDNFHCIYCERDLHGAASMDLTLDHLLPDSQGGCNSPKNLVLACRKCNCSRQDMPWRQFAKTEETIKRVIRHTRRQITKYRTLAKAIINGDADDPRD